MNFDLTGFHPDTRALIVGASGGIGQAIVEQLQQSGIASIHALFRSTAPRFAGSVTTGSIDLLDESSVSDAVSAAAEPGPFDLVIVATGILHRDDELRPEKSLRDIDAEQMLEVFRVNTIGPALVAKYCLPHMRRGQKSVFAALSARVGSIGDNRLGGWASYRASKAALNMLLRTLAIEQSRRFPESIVVGLHPGTVDTALSGPFTGRVPAERLFSTQQSAGYLLKVIDGLKPDDTGGVFAWDGSRIEY